MKRILVCKRRGLGDALLMTPAIEVLRKNFPEAEITVLVPHLAREIFHAQPGVAQVWSFEDYSMPSLLLKILRNRFDIVFDLNSTGQTRLLSKLIRFTRLTRVVSHTHDKATTVRYPQRPNGVEWDVFAVGEALPNLAIPPSSFLLPRFYLYEEELKAADEFWRGRGIRNRNVVVLGVGATKSTKRWPAAHFARFAERVRGRLNMSLAILVGPSEDDRQFANAVVKEINSLRVPIDDAGSFVVERVAELRTFAALVAKSYAYVGNDSGPKHIAAAVGTPTLTLFGPEDPLEWHPYDSEDHPYLFAPKLTCRKEDGGRWCGLSECVVEKHRCMTSLDPDQAFQAFLRIKRKPLVHDIPVLASRPPLPR